MTQGRHAGLVPLTERYYIKTKKKEKMKKCFDILEQWNAPQVWLIYIHFYYIHIFIKTACRLHLQVRE